MKARRNTRRGQEGVATKYQAMWDNLTEEEKEQWEKNGEIEIE